MKRTLIALTLMSSIGTAVADGDRSYYRRAVHHHVYGYTSGVGSCNVRGSGHDSVTMTCRGDDEFRRGVADAVMDLGPKIALALNETFSSPGFNPLSSRAALPVTVIPMKVTDGAVSLSEHFEVKAERDRLRAIVAALPPSVLPEGVDYAVAPPTAADILSERPARTERSTGSLMRAVYRPPARTLDRTTVVTAKEPGKAFKMLAEQVNAAERARFERTLAKLKAKEDKHTEIKVEMRAPITLPPRPAAPGHYALTDAAQVGSVRAKAGFAPLAAELADGGTVLAIGPFLTAERANEVAARIGSNQVVGHEALTWVN